MGKNYIMITREEFANQDHDSLKMLKNTLMAIVFVPQELLLKARYSQDYKNELITNGWEYFLKSFRSPCSYTRMGWSLYFIVFQEQRKNAIKIFKDIFQGWSPSSDSLYWRIVFTEIKNSNRSWKDIISNLECHGRDAVRNNFNQKLFFFNLETNLVDSIPL